THPILPLRRTLSHTGNRTLAVAARTPKTPVLRIGTEPAPEEPWDRTDTPREEDQMQPRRPRIKGVAARAGHWSATHRKRAIGLWLAFVIVAVIGGGAVGQRSLTDAESNVGESKAAEMTLANKGPHDRATESVLVQSSSETSSSPQFRSALESVRHSLESTGQYSKIDEPKPSPDGDAALVDAD